MIALTCFQPMLVVSMASVLSVVGERTARPAMDHFVLPTSVLVLDLGAVSENKHYRCMVGNWSRYRALENSTNCELDSCVTCSLWACVAVKHVQNLRKEQGNSASKGNLCCCGGAHNGFTLEKLFDMSPDIEDRSSSPGGARTAA